MKTYSKRRRKYLSHRWRAKRLNISWHFNYVQWCRKWLESGKWKQRGPYKEQYCMARCGDKEPYSYENTKIITQSENVKERKFSPESLRKMSFSKIGNKNRLGKKHSAETRKKMSLSQTGKIFSFEYREKLAKAQQARRAREAQERL